MAEENSFSPRKYLSNGRRGKEEKKERWKKITEEISAVSSKETSIYKRGGFRNRIIKGREFLRGNKSAGETAGRERTQHPRCARIEISGFSDNFRPH